MSRGDESAYPLFCPHANGAEITYGLTKREYFAALAMQGLLAGQSHNGTDSRVTADFSLMHADALLAALDATS